MSTYNRETKHPVTGKWEKATWFDDYFGNHNYGVMFPSDNEGKEYRADDFIVYDPREVKLETREPKQETDVTQDGKVITTTEHPDGRKDVNIKVNMLDVKETDPATLKAKKHIEDVIIPELANASVLVVVVHKPDNIFAQKLVKAPHVRAFAEAAVKMHGGKPEDYVIVEHHITNNTVQVSSL